jgi:hypothetical protein
MILPYMKEKMFRIALLALACVGFGRVWYELKDGFSFSRLAFALPPSASYPTDPLSQEEETRLLQALSQEYHYLGRGRQCYAFESEDGHYVLKLPRFDRYRLPLYLRLFGGLEERKERLIEDKRERLEMTLKSFQIAHNELKKQTALLASHIHPTDHLPSTLFIRDKIGRRYSINPNLALFVLQEKRPILMKTFQDHWRRQDIDEAKKALNAFLDVVVTRARAGVFNKDPSFMKNFGYDGSDGVMIDVGSLFKKEELASDEAFHRSLREGTGPMKDWLAELNPELKEWFEKRIDEVDR